MNPVVVASAAEVLAAVFAILIARHRRSYMPAAIALTLFPVMSILDGMIAPVLDAAAVPYQGTARLLFHVETALLLGGDATVAGLALVVAVPPDQRRRVVAIVGTVWLLASAVVAVLYPSPLVRGFGLTRIYFASTLLGLCIGTIALVTRVRASIDAKRSPDANDLIALALVVFDASGAGIAFWPVRSGALSAESYSGVQVLIVCVFTVIAIAEVVAWLLIRSSG
jgi:hypothetical protein